MTPSGGTIAGITTAAIALSAATAIMLWFVFRRFRHHRAAARTSYIKHVELAEGGAMAGVGWEPCQSAEPPVNARALQRQQQRRVAVVMQQLDTFRDGAELLLGRFEVLPRGTCMHGSALQRLRIRPESSDFNFVQGSTDAHSVDNCYRVEDQFTSQPQVPGHAD